MSPYLDRPAKRALDIFFSLLVLPVALPLVLVSAIITVFSDGGPAFFIQERIGFDAKPFKMLKIRTLRKTFLSSEGQQHQVNDILWVGKLLRKFRIDELPQIWNILNGEMSWVGPRPEIPHYFEIYKNLDPQFVKRQQCRPGITGLAQLHNPDATPENSLEKLPNDLKYIEHASLFMDIIILLKSFFLVWK
jgi:lipopolysaccharide/colanic/teichoic acid biosynthesis glycosyltransferase